MDGVAWLSSARGEGCECQAMSNLVVSYQHCERIVRRSGSNFAWSFWLLGREKRLAMVALYAYARITDDIGDSERPIDEKIAALAQWKSDLQQTLATGDTNDHVLRALHDTVTRFQIPAKLLTDIIAGVRFDLYENRFPSRGDLDRYCYQVAGAVGLACIYVWGFNDPRALELAETCGRAFQMTNILRDLKEDAARGRVYLPLDELTLFDYSPEELLQGVLDERFDRMMEFELSRNEAQYVAAREIVPLLSSDGRRVFKLMWGRYRAILAEIRRAPRDVWRRRVSLTFSQKLGVAASQLWS